MPDPSKYDDQGDFVSACIKQRQDEHPEEDTDQSAAVCYGMWKDKALWTKAITKQLAPEGDESEDDFMERCTDELGDEDVCQQIWDDSGGDDDGKALKPNRAPVIHKTHASEINNGMEFILSDATPDRYGDVIAAEGWDLANFAKNPVALFNHNPDFPIGSWSGLRVVGDALRGHLKFAPEGTSPRIDEIRKLVDAGILRAVSVGFKPIESKARSRTDRGEIYLKQELVETSLVSVPANPNAIAVAKSLHVSDDTLKLVFAEHGTKRRGLERRRTTNGKQAETSLHRKMQNMTPIAQRIQDTQARITKYTEELETHMKNVDDENPTEESLTITKELSEKIEKQQASLDALKSAEQKLMTAAVKANGGDGKGNNGNGTGTALTIHNARPFAFPAKKVQPIDHLCRAITVALKHHDQKGQYTLEQVLRNTYGEGDQSDITRIVMGQMVSKAASIPADTTTVTWATELVQTVIGEFIAALMPLSIYPKLAAKGGSFTFGRNGTISLPARNSATTIAGSFFAQGAPIPVRQGAFTAITLTPKKLGVITTLTREITEHSTPSIEGIVRQAILEDTAVAIDSILIDANPATTTRPAGLKNGIAAITATAGGAIAAVIGDLKALIGALITSTRGNLRAPTWIMNPADALAISLTQAAAGGTFPFLDEISAGTLMGYSLITSTTCPVDTMFLVDAADFITATGDTPRFDVSDQAVLHMEDTTPLQISTVGTPPTVAAPARSLWQTDTIGIRMIMDLNWAMRRTGCVQWTTAMTWN